MNADGATARDLAERYGRFLRRTDHGEMYEFPGGRRVVLNHASMGDHVRGWKNCLADVKRALRAAGIDFEDHEEEDVPETTTSSTTFPSPPGPASAEASPTMFVRRRRVVVETDAADVTVDFPEILARLGVALPEDGKVVRVVDALGQEVAGPLTIFVEGPTRTREE